MEWKQLFSRERLVNYYSGEKTAEYEDRSDFQRDFDRIVFSSAFRRLYGKTQLIPIPYNPFIRTRLTHSLEAASVGRSLGRLAGSRITQSDKVFGQEGITPDDFGSIVAAACLAHDIGNPPLGHAGEDAICDFFRNPRGRKLTEGLAPEQRADLETFQGNALGFRLLTHTLPAQSSRRGGLGLTHATIGSFTKYPKESLPENPSKKASEKSFGFFQADKDQFSLVAEKTGLKKKEPSKRLLGHSAWCRHPLAFLVEAADDICYRVCDLEDGHKLRLVTFRETESLLSEIAGPSLRQGSYRGISDNDEKIGYLRAVAINELVRQVAQAFVDGETKFLEGVFEKTLCDCIPAKDVIKKIQSTSEERIYQYESVLQIEAAGFEVLPGLLDAFLTAVSCSPQSKRASTILGLIPRQYLDEKGRPFQDQYLSILYVTQFIACMTDTFAIDTYRTIKGIQLPNY